MSALSTRCQRLLRGIGVAVPSKNALLSSHRCRETVQLFWQHKATDVFGPTHAPKVKLLSPHYTGKYDSVDVALNLEGDPVYSVGPGLAVVDTRVTDDLGQLIGEGGPHSELTQLISASSTAGWMNGDPVLCCAGVPVDQPHLNSTPSHVVAKGGHLQRNILVKLISDVHQDLLGAFFYALHNHWEHSPLVAAPWLTNMMAIRALQDMGVAPMLHNGKNDAAATVEEKLTSDNPTTATGSGRALDAGSGIPLRVTALDRVFRTFVLPTELQAFGMAEEDMVGALRYLLHHFVCYYRTFPFHRDVISITRPALTRNEFKRTANERLTKYEESTRSSWERFLSSTEGLGTPLRTSEEKALKQMVRQEKRLKLEETPVMIEDCFTWHNGINLLKKSRSNDIPSPTALVESLSSLEQLTTRSGTKKSWTLQPPVFSPPVVEQGIGELTEWKKLLLSESPGYRRCRIQYADNTIKALEAEVAASPSVERDHSSPKNSPRSVKGTFYAVALGRVSGVFRSWSEVEKLVVGVPGAVHKKFSNKADALQFVASGGKISSVTTIKKEALPTDEIDHDGAVTANTAKKGLKKKGTKKKTDSVSPSTKSTSIKTATVDPNDGWLHVFTDGSYRATDAKGGKAGLGMGAVFVNEERLNFSERITASSGVSETNNAAEVLAAIRVLQKTPSMTDVHIHTDSRYLELGARKRKVWLSQKKSEELPNRVLWEQLDRLISTRRGKLKVTWVKGHSVCKLNQQADALARAGADGKSDIFL